MKALLVALTFALLITTTFSCQQSTQATLEYDKLDYDTSRIIIFQLDSENSVFPGSAHPLPMTQEDINLIDSLLKDAIDTFNNKISPALYQVFSRDIPLDSFVIKKDKYKYQYIPYKDVNGQRIVAIIGFLNDFALWKKQLYQPRIHYGMHMLELTINLTKRSRSDIRSGDFG